MPVSVELKTLNHAVDDLRTAVASLHGKYGDVPAVARLRNDLERLQLDVGDVEKLPATVGTPQPELQPISDEPYDPRMWAEDADDEGLGGYHGNHGTHR